MENSEDPMSRVTFGQIEKKLIENGQIYESNKLASRSTARDFRKIQRWRDAAKRNGFTDYYINSLEMAGMVGNPHFVERPYELIEEAPGVLDGISIRQFTLIGAHPKNGSTLSAREYVHMRIWPYVLMPQEVVWEYFKETFQIWRQLVKDRIYDVRIFIKLNWRKP